MAGITYRVPVGGLNTTSQVELPAIHGGNGPPWLHVTGDRTATYVLPIGWPGVARNLPMIAHA
jgi:hypothetical protein